MHVKSLNQLVAYQKVHIISGMHLYVYSTYICIICTFRVYIIHSITFKRHFEYMTYGFCWQYDWISFRSIISGMLNISTLITNVYTMDLNIPIQSTITGTWVSRAKISGEMWLWTIIWTLIPDSNIYGGFDISYFAAKYFNSRNMFWIYQRDF